VNPVGGEETTEGRDKDTTTAVWNAASQITDLSRITEETQVVHQEGDTTTGDGNATLEGIDRLAFLAHLKTDGGKKTMFRDNGLVTNVVKHEATSTVGVLSHTRSEGTVANQGRGLVTQTASDGDTIQRTGVDAAKAIAVGGRNNVGKADLVAIDAKEVKEAVIIVKGLKVHELSPRGIADVSDMNIPLGTAVEVVEQPGVYGTKGQTTLIVGLFDFG